MVETLFPYILLFYLIDCFSFTKNSYLLFVSHWGRKFAAQSPGINLSGFFPFGQSFLVSSLPFILTEKGIYSLQGAGTVIEHARIPIWTLLPYEEFEHVAAESQSITIDKKTFLKLSSSKEAMYIANLIIDIKKAPYADRSSMVKNYLMSRADLKKAEDIRTVFRPIFLYLSVLSSLLFVLTFIIIPTLVYSGPYSFVKTTPFIASNVFLYFMILATAFFWHKKIYPDDLQSQVTFLLLMILIPPSAIHLLDKITRDMFVEYDHLTLASILLPENTFKKFFREEWERISNWRDELEADLREFWEMKKKSQSKIIRK